MDWTQALTVIGVNVVLIGILCTVLIWVLNKLDSDRKFIRKFCDIEERRK